MRGLHLYSIGRYFAGTGFASALDARIASVSYTAERS